jgi:hypothetical protein
MGARGMRNHNIKSGDSDFCLPAIVFPAAPLFLFMHGKDVTIPKGTEITAYTNGEIKLQREKFATGPSTPSGSTPATISQSPASPSAPAATSPSPSARRSSIVITSLPEGADIEVNGKFVGNTPSTLEIQSGAASVTVKKNGFKTWTSSIEMSLERIPGCFRDAR